MDQYIIEYYKKDLTNYDIIKLDQIQTNKKNLLNDINNILKNNDSSIIKHFNYNDHYKYIFVKNVISSIDLIPFEKFLIIVKK